MSDAIDTRNQLEIDKAFQYAVTSAWGEFKAARPQSIRVEYLCERAAALNHLSVWSVRDGGYQDLVFDYSVWTSSAHPTGARLVNGHYPEGLAQTLDFIMQHQNQFTRPADAGRHGLVLIYPPAEGDDRIKAATWMKGVQALGIEASPEEAQKRVPGEPVEAPEKTNATNHFELRYAWPE